MGTKLLEYEAGQAAFAFTEATADADRIVFTSPQAPLSQASGSEAVIAPYGLLTGGAITPTGVNDEISVAALTVQAPGMTGADADGIVAVSSGTVTISRGLTTDTHRINSITVDSSGSLAVVAGVDHTEFSEVRGADGGPPLIPVGSIEIGQVRVTSIAAAAVSASEIFQVDGAHVERATYPPYSVDYATGEITFAAALPEIHTGPAPRKVYVRGATPIFAAVPNASAYVPAENSYSVSSEETYDGPVGSSSSSLGQGSFNAICRDGLSDPFLQFEGENLWFKFRPDRDKATPYNLTQGTLGVARTFPAGGGSITASCTINATSKSVTILS